jgi:hypothetical protein
MALLAMLLVLVLRCGRRWVVLLVMLLLLVLVVLLVLLLVILLMLLPKRGAHLRAATLQILTHWRLCRRQLVLQRRRRRR